LEAGALIAEVVTHQASDWREQSQVRTPLLLQLQLPAANAFANLVIRDDGISGIWRAGGIVRAGHLPRAPGAKTLRNRGEVAVAIDDHRASLTPWPGSTNSSSIDMRFGIRR